MTHEIDIDKTARDLPRVCLHGRIPTETTMALAARVVELLSQEEQLLANLHEALHGDVCSVELGDHTQYDIVKWVKALRARAMKWAHEIERLRAHVKGLEDAQQPRPIDDVVFSEVTVVLGELAPNEWSIVEWVHESKRWCVFEDEELNEVFPYRFLPCPSDDQCRDTTKKAQADSE